MKIGHYVTQLDQIQFAVPFSDAVYVAIHTKINILKINIQNPIMKTRYHHTIPYHNHFMALFPGPPR